jgi:hypothetical protein
VNENAKSSSGIIEVSGGDSSLAHKPAHSHIRRVFLTTVSVFLVGTALSKLGSVLLETPVLHARDPLIGQLPVRQMLFAAAVLELLAAWHLVRLRDLEATPWILLWLVAVFTTYRAGLSTIRFHGYCPCLGHLFDWAPGFKAWADRLMLFSLAFMGGGSLCLLRRRLRFSREFGRRAEQLLRWFLL